MSRTTLWFIFIQAVFMFVTLAYVSYFTVPSNSNRPCIQTIDTKIFSQHAENPVNQDFSVTQQPSDLQKEDVVRGNINNDQHVSIQNIQDRNSIGTQKSTEVTTSGGLTPNKVTPMIDVIVTKSPSPVLKIRAPPPTNLMLGYSYYGPEPDLVHINHRNKPRLLFSINSGRCGSGYLFKLIQGAGAAKVYHEAHPVMNGVFLRNSSLMGLEATKSLRMRKITTIEAQIARLNYYPPGPLLMYAESSHLFFKAFMDLVIEKLLPKYHLTVVLLSRYLPEVLASQVQSRVWRAGCEKAKAETYDDWYYDPSKSKIAVTSPNPPPTCDRHEGLDIAMSYLIDVEMQKEKFKRLYSNHPDIHIAEVRLEALNSEDAVYKFFGQIGIPRAAVDEKHQKYLREGVIGHEYNAAKYVYPNKPTTSTGLQTTSTSQSQAVSESQTTGDGSAPLPKEPAKAKRAMELEEETNNDGVNNKASDFEYDATRIAKIKSLLREYQKPEGSPVEAEETIQQNTQDDSQPSNKLAPNNPSRYADFRQSQNSNAARNSNNNNNNNNNNINNNNNVRIVPQNARPPPVTTRPTPKSKTPPVPPKPILVLPVSEYKELLEDWINTRYEGQNIVVPSMIPYKEKDDNNFVGQNPKS